MTKILGFLIMQASAILFSMQQLHGKRRKLESLRAFCEMLQQLGGILASSAPPMPELIQLLSRRSRDEARRFAERLSMSMDKLGDSSFQELWNSALSECAAQLDDEIIPDLTALGEVLGRYELNAQLQALEACRDKLQRRADSLQAELPGSARITFGLLLSSTLLIGILLL